MQKGEAMTPEEMAERFMSRIGALKRLVWTPNQQMPNALVVARPKSNWSVGGGAQVIAATASQSQWQNVAVWSTADGTSEAGTITVSHTPWVYAGGASPPPNPYQPYPGIAVMVQMGGDKGFSRTFYRAPCVVPFSGSSVSVNVIACGQGAFDVEQPLESGGVPVYGGAGANTATYTTTVRCVVTEGWGGYPTQPVGVISGGGAVAYAAFAPYFSHAIAFGGPLIPASLTLTNVGANAAYVVIGDGGGAPFQAGYGGAPFLQCVVPAGQNIGIGQGLLMPVSQGLYVTAVTSLTPTAGVYTPDATNGPNVYVNASAYLIE
jgi:hypothetical protein